MSTRPRIVPDPPAGGLEAGDFSAALWRAVDDAPSLPEATARVVELVRLRTGGDAAGLCTRDERGELVRLAARGHLLDEPSGPHADVAHDPLAHPLADGGVLAIDETRGDATWPDWSAGAARRGIRSARFVGLASLHARPVVLELYAAHAHAFDGPCAALVVDAACQAGCALRQVERVADLERDGRHRALVGQASGLLMERYHLSADQAMDYLTRTSERAHLDLHDLARELVAAQDRAAAHTRTPFPGRPERPGSDGQEGVSTT
jgi:hypothetical protein